MVAAVGLEINCRVDGDGATGDGDLCIIHRDGADVGAVADDDIARAFLNHFTEPENDVAVHRNI